MKEGHSRISLCVSILALILSFYSIMRTIKLEHKNDQMDSVVSLVEYVNQMKILISFHNDSTSRSFPQLNIFQLDTLFVEDVNRNSRVFIPEMKPLAVHFAEYEQDPNMPKTIVRSLRAFKEEKFCPPGIYQIEKNMSYVTILNGSDLELFQFQYPDSLYLEKVHWMSFSAYAYENFENFVNASMELKKNILRWSSKYNVELNLIE